MERLVIPQTDAAKVLGVAVRTLERWRVEGRGPRFVKLGSRVGYRPEDLVAFVDAGRRQSTSQTAEAEGLDGNASAR